MFRVIFALVLVTIFHVSSSLSHRAQDVVVSKKEATSFYKRFFLDNDIYEECYGEESCDFEEVVEKYGHSEQSYEYWNTYTCNTTNKRCKDVACRGYPIGMESGKISDENIVASSWQEPFHAFRPEKGRLQKDDGVWCPNTLGEVDKGYYLQVEFPGRYNICAVATQGSPLYDTDWVTKYRLQYSMDGQNFTFYTENGEVKEFSGNTNAKKMVKNDLSRPITAHFIRFVPVEWNYKPCMRVEVYGSAIACPWKTKNDKCCVFPFTYKGKKYYKCIVDWVWMPWCATTSNFDKDNEWENCLPKSKQ